MKVTRIGGTETMSFLWNNGVTDSINTNVLAGRHVVTVTDANGCKDSSSILLTEPAVLMVGSTGSMPTGCSTSDGVAFV